jgi:RNA polymerase sigma-70 factor (ECF subfamily)
VERDPSELLTHVAQTRSREAFAQLFHHYAPRIKGMLIARGADPVQAEEVAQDTLLTVWHQAGRFDAGRASASAWIYTIARNKHVDRARKVRRADAPEPTAPAPEPPDHQLAVARDKHALNRALDQLPPEQASVLRASFFDFRTQAQIADDQGVAVGTIKSRTRLGLSRLRQLLETP